MVSTDYEWLHGVDTGHSRFARPVTLSLVRTTQSSASGVTERLHCQGTRLLEGE